MRFGVHQFAMRGCSILPIPETLATVQGLTTSNRFVIYDAMTNTTQVKPVSRQANYIKRRRASFLCHRCGVEPLDLNAKTGMPYSYGPACRVLVNGAQAKQMKARRAAGNA